MTQDSAQMNSGWGGPPGGGGGGGGYGGPPGNPPGGGGYGGPPGGGGYGGGPPQGGPPPQGGGGYGGPPGGGYGGQPPGYPQPHTPPSTNNAASGMAIAALVLGAVSWVFGLSLLTAIPGIIVARIELKNIERGDSGKDGKILAQIGFWASLANIVVMGGLVVVWFCLFGAGIVVALLGQAGNAG